MVALDQLMTSKCCHSTWQNSMFCFGPADLLSVFCSVLFSWNWPIGTFTVSFPLGSWVGVDHSQQDQGRLDIDSPGSLFRKVGDYFQTTVSSNCTMSSFRSHITNLTLHSLWEFSIALVFCFFSCYFSTSSSGLDWRQTVITSCILYTKLQSLMETIGTCISCKKMGERSLVPGWLVEDSGIYHSQSKTTPAIADASWPYEGCTRGWWSSCSHPWFSWHLVHAVYWEESCMADTSATALLISDQAVSGSPFLDISYKWNHGVFVLCFWFLS